MSVIVFKYSFECLINTRYENFGIADIESAELLDNSVIFKLKNGTEQEFKLADGVGTQHIEDVVDGLGEPAIFPVN